MIRQYKIAVCGVHGGGKTTRIKEMKRDLEDAGLSFVVVKEVARDCPHSLGTVKAQRWIWHEHYSREVDAMSQGCEIVLCDRTLMDNLVYLKHIVDREEGRYGKDIFEFLHAVTRTWMETYDKIIRLPLNEKWITDDERDTLRPKDLVYAREIDELFDEMVEPYVAHHKGKI